MTMSDQPGSREWPLVLDYVTHALDSLAELLGREDDFIALFNQVCAQVTRAVPGVDHATVTLLRDHSAETMAWTSDRVVDLDATQYEAGRGPCLDAAETERIVRVRVEDAATRWPEFSREARAAGMRSFLSAPLIVDGDYSGAVNCYSRQPHGFEHIEAQLLELYTTAVEASLRAYRRYEEARQVAADLRLALQSRAVIDQAKGIIMAARGVSAEKAFALLVEQSQRENIKVREVAERFVAGMVDRDERKTGT